MANVTPFGESDIPSHELICQETDSQWSQVTVATKSEPSPSPQEEAVSMSESNGIPDVPGRHKITTCKDVGFFATASTTHEAIMSSSSESHVSNASGSTQGDNTAAGTEEQSSPNIVPLKNAARVSDLLRSGTEGDSGKGQISTLEGRESGISLNESLLLSVDLTSADLGTICDVNDKNYYQQMVLRSLLNAGDMDQCDSERRAVTDAEASFNEDKNLGQEIHNLDSEKVISSLVEASTGYDLAQVCVKSDDRTGKFRVVQLDCSSQEVFEDAAGSHAKNSGESLPAVNAADTTNISAEETITEDVLTTAPSVVSDGDSEEKDDKSFIDMLPSNDSKNVSDTGSEIDMNLQKYSSEDRSIPTVEESTTAPRETATETGGLIHRSRSDNTVHQFEKDDRNVKNRSVVLLETLFRTGAENSVAAAVKAGFCFIAVFILLYAPSTIVNILTLYLQLLVCAIFVDIFLN